MNVLYKVQYFVYIYIFKDKNLIEIFFIFSDIQPDGRLGCLNLTKINI